MAALGLLPAPGVHGQAADLIAADLILVGGKIVSVDAKDGIYEAMAVRDGRILRVGTNEEVGRLSGPNTTVVDLGGRTVLPGLIDSHTHSAEAAVAEFDHEIPPMASISDVLGYVSQRAGAVEPGEWVVVEQVFFTRLAEWRYPTKEELDRAAPDHPVIFRTGSEAVLNEKALARLGIDRDFEAPAGSEVETEPGTGAPTGFIRGWKAIFSVPQTGKTPANEDRRAWLRRLIADYNATGITAFADRRVYEHQARLYADLEQRGDLTARVALLRYIDTSAPADSIRSQIRDIARDPLRLAQPLVRTIGVKTYADGGMLSGTAFMLEPWGTGDVYGITDESYRGMPLISPEKIRVFARTALEEGLQPTVHAVGDGAVDLAVQAYASLAASMPAVTFPRLRPCVTHANFIGTASIRMMAEHGIVTDIQPVWLYMDAAVLEAHFGYDRMSTFQRLRTLFDHGVVVGGGSDHMKKIGPFRSINPYSPFLGMETAVTRRARNYRGRLHPEEGLSRMEAIRMYTINNAFIMLMDQEIGSLEPGKLADFTVLDRDILTVPEDEISEIEVLQTYLGGTLIYQR